MIEADITIEDYFQILADSMKTAAEEELEEISPAQKQSHILAETWKLIEERQKAREKGRPEEETIE